MNDTLICPAEGELENLLLAGNGEENDSLVAHLEGCEVCQRRMEQIAARGVTWSAIAKRIRAGQSVTPSRPAALEAAIQKLKQNASWVVDSPETNLSIDLPPGLLGPPKQPGQLGSLDDYEVFEEVGRGAMGIVLRAFDPKLHRVVAIKVMSPALAAFPLARQRFVREGHSVAAVCHENVVAVHAVGEVSGIPFLVMQYVAGKTLQERLDQGGPLHVDDILRIGMQAAAGLAAAHAQGLVHRDIKPANLLLENGVERVKLTDFGLARAVDDASITQTGVISGTPQFMSPEQAQGEPVDSRSDLFSLGCMLYALATGRPPFRGSSTPAVLKRICEMTPPPIRERNPNIPDWLAGIIVKLLAKKPADRFSSAKELSELLGQCLEHWRQPHRSPLPTVATALAQTQAAQLTVTPAANASTRPTNAEAYAWLKTPLALLLLFAALLFPLSKLNKWIDRWLGPASTTEFKAEFKQQTLVGTWKLVSLHTRGLQAPDELVDKLSVRFDDQKLEFVPGEPGFTHFGYRVEATASPPHIDLTHEEGASRGKKLLGIYRLEDNTLKICLGEDERPTSFEGSKYVVYVLTRISQKRE
jgi:uncharacterized protein (TIGR03067 family)